MIESTVDSREANKFELIQKRGYREGGSHWNVWWDANMNVDWFLRYGLVSMTKCKQDRRQANKYHIECIENRRCLMNDRDREINRERQTVDTSRIVATRIRMYVGMTNVWFFFLSVFFFFFCYFVQINSLLRGGWPLLVNASGSLHIRPCTFPFPPWFVSFSFWEHQGGCLVELWWSYCRLFDFLGLYKIECDGKEIETECMGYTNNTTLCLVKRFALDQKHTLKFPYFSIKISFRFSAITDS